MSEADPIAFRPRKVIDNASRGNSSRSNASGHENPHHHSQPAQICFNRRELNDILQVYGRQVAAGEWRDYAIDMGRDKAVFSIFRRASEFPLYRIEKNPKLARKQGAYSVVAPGGQILKRGHELKRVLEVIDARIKAVT